jgi:hypothetical protein
MSFNPYQPPTSAYDGTYTNPANAGTVVTEGIVASLRKTRPWALLIAVCSFVYAGIFGLSGLILLFKTPAQGLLLVLMAAISALPGAFLVRYAGAIHKLLHGGGVPELEQAIAAQASFWQVTGIFTLVAIAFGMLAVIGAIAGVSSFLGGF